MNYKEKTKSINKMVEGIELLRVTLRINVINTPGKDIEWPNGYKKVSNILHKFYF